MNLCERCSQPATLWVAVGGVERWACNACADSLTAIRGLGALAEGMRRPARRDGKCPNCGVTEEDARKNGLVGCPLCYAAFRDSFWSDIAIPRGRWTRSELW
ncbi:hypothetical protein [Fimbriimonas ginsengisoli]|uniref:Uncharacterized protein n=1 Tax=Fimbriimonas ginsengisoli Gsoil 348 TaxID=661478 RepID=A0A068NXB5_FIMGI|nr:hypothetical protein [Fimbriimonas ginsengisoli]AIE88046.1 hypothetical protein OP10G_4678 [Fimbriimonas ginsengisoli Gsoil 348]